MFDLLNGHLYQFCVLKSGSCVDIYRHLPYNVSFSVPVSGHIETPCKLVNKRDGIFHVNLQFKIFYLRTSQILKFHSFPYKSNLLELWNFFSSVENWFKCSTGTPDSKRNSHLTSPCKFNYCEQNSTTICEWSGTRSWEIRLEMRCASVSWYKI